MKVKFANRSEKLLVIAAFIVLTLITLTAIQSTRNKSLRDTIKRNTVIVKELEAVNEDLMEQIDISETSKEIMFQKMDSVEKSETYFKNKYYATNEKLKSILGNYNSSSNATKNELFTNAVNN
jgi:GTPase involved in cell partitioning and DNA repair